MNKERIELEKNLIYGLQNEIKQNNELIKQYQDEIKRLKFDNLNCKNAIKSCKEEIVKLKGEK